LGFQGDHTDPTTGSVILGPRQYDPTTARFTSPDVYAAGDLDLGLGTDELTGNRYLFAAANPVAYYEDGHWPSWRRWGAKSRSRPANGSDLVGSRRTCAQNRSLCARYLATGGSASRIYFGFSAGQLSRLRSLQKDGAVPSYDLDWSTDSCSGLGKVTNGVMFGSFGNACGKHDIGYRNHRAIFGRTNEDDRKVIDNQLRRDSQDTCTQFGVVASGRTGIYYADAETQYRAVRQFGRPYY
jgi:RHS repeat-associated protein